MVRARYPDVEDHVDRDGVKIGYEVYGSGEPTVLLLTSWAIAHARQWKGQIPYLARHFRVVVVEARGNGRTDRPGNPAAYARRELVEDVIAVLDAVGVDQAVVVGLSASARRALDLAAGYPDRVLGVCAVAPAVTFEVTGFDEVRDRYDGLHKVNRHYLRRDYRGFLEFWWAAVFTEPRSTKQREDGIAWSMETTADTVTHFFDDWRPLTPFDLETLCRAVRCPVLVVHGTADAIVEYEDGVMIAEQTGGTLVTMPGAGHAPPLRQPVRTNLLIRDFAESLAGPRPRRVSWTPGRDRGRRALFLSSPIGLGHVRRDLAIANELRVLQPDVKIDWLAQHPVSEVLTGCGEHVHPASRSLASESGHLEAQSGEHDLRVFQSIREMDEILLANFMVFQDLVAEESYDLWVADESWELDHFLHENPELKRAAYAWLTDFVGWLPMPDGGEREAALTADYNAEMLEHVARYPRIRDRAIFVGDLEDVVPDRFGPGLPLISEWTREHYDFPGYITGFDPITAADRDGVRAELGWRADEQVCLVTVGGTGVGLPLLRRVVDAYPQAARLVPGLRMIVVAGPRIDPAMLPAHPGLEVHGYLPDLYRHLAVCDLAVTHGGLSTTMELAANQRPFLYLPLRGHFEQNLHVRHRLDRYRAGRCLDYGSTGPEELASAIADEIARKVDYRPVAPGGARRAAIRLAELL